jgi:hypothetical protein
VLAAARARLDDWNEWCPDTWCEGSFQWFAYDLRGDATRSEVTMRTYSRQRAAVPDLSAVDVSGHGFRAHVLAQHVVTSCVVPCLPAMERYEIPAPCLVLDVRFELDLPVSAEFTPTAGWDATLIDAGIALEQALRMRVPEDLDP